MNDWSNLPNAKHIDTVIASVKANPKIWAVAWEKAGGWTNARDAAWDAAWDAAYSARGAVWDAAFNAARDAVWDAAFNAARDAAWSAAFNVARNAARNASRNAILALVAYDDCAHLLTTKPEHVKMMAGLGDEVAILLHPASLVFSEIKNERLV